MAKRAAALTLQIPSSPPNFDRFLAEAGQAFSL
jgi:hypothetical protein